MSRRGHLTLLFIGAAIVGSLAGSACTSKTRKDIARGALDAVDTADRTCQDLHSALHRDAGGD